MKDNLIIVYYIYLPPDRNWKIIVDGQLNDLKNIGILDYGKLYIHISSLHIDLIDLCKEFIKSKYNPTKLTSNIENLYEYPGLKLMHDLAQINPESIIFYMHSKGMVFTPNYNKEIRNELESILLRNTIYYHDKAISLFEENKNINKIGLYPSHDGFIWFNFFWIRSKFLIDKEPPIITDDRYYYEYYIGNKSFSDCYSLLENKICYYPHQNVINCTYNFSKEMLDINIHFNKLNFKVEYGTNNNKIDITQKVLLNCITGNNIFIPSGDNNRIVLFGDPFFGFFKSIFINNREYKIYSNIYIESFNTIYQIDEIPENLKLLSNF